MRFCTAFIRLHKMKVLKLTVRLDAYVEADCTDDQAMDLAVNAVEIKSSDPRVEVEIETVEVEAQK